MALFKSTAELKKYCPAINRNTAWETFAPAVEQAEQKYILPLLGKDQFDELATAVTSDDFTDKLTVLLPYVQRPLAYYAFYEALPLLGPMVSDMGITEQSSSEGTATPARQWVYHKLEDSAVQNGDTFADVLLSFLEDNHTDYPLWAASPAFTITKELFINSIVGFETEINLNGSKRVWLAIRPFVKQAEAGYILPAITGPLFDDLKTKMKASLTTALSAEYKLLLEKIKAPLAWWAVYKALPFAAIQFTPAGLVMSATLNSRSLKPSTERMALAAARTEAESNALSALRHLKKWLDENCEDYPLYESNFEASQPNYQLPDNQGKKSFMV